MTPDDELIQAFLEESTENLDQLDLDLVALEANPADPELIARIFRVIHTVKGTCGFLDYRHLEALSHAGEDLLAALRDGRLLLDDAITTSLLRLVDEIRAVLASVEHTGQEGDSDHAELIVELRGHLDRPQAPIVKPDPPTPAQGPQSTPLAHEETAVRIDVAVLDKLQDLVGELTLARLRLGDHVRDDDMMAQAFRQLTTTTRDLQSTVMQARLQPISTVTDRLRRIVRDLAAREGKQIHLTIGGDQVPVDKAINEILRDPLVHLVRNAVDHGIETPDQRRSAGKTEAATLHIEAAVIAGRLQITVSDDGRGIDTAALVQRAIADGRITAEHAATLPEAGRQALLFLAGVSTATQVTTVSGRGVGMDVVRTNLEQVGGTIDLTSEPGQGTTFQINVPLTLAILPAIVVVSAGSRYTIPQVDVDSIVQIAVQDLPARIETVADARLLHHHGSLLPLIDLGQWLGTGARPPDAPAEIVVIRHHQLRYGLMVDEVGDSIEAVVKPLPRALRGLAHYAGVTVLSDGRPSLILETSAPAADAGLRPETDDVTEPMAPTDPRSVALLTVGVAEDRLAIPLDLVIRLLQSTADQIEHSNHEEVIQHRSAILPLIRMGEVLGLPLPAAAQALPIVVCTSAHGPVGLVVDEILDIEWADISAAQEVAHPCLAGRLIVGGKVTELIHLPAVLAEARRQPSGEVAHG